MSDVDELLQRAQQLHTRLLGITIGGPGWSGNVRDGFIFNPEPQEISGDIRPQPPVTGTGACCVGSVCSIKTAAGCAAAGGIFKGVGTSCTPCKCPTPLTYTFNSVNVFDGFGTYCDASTPCSIVGPNDFCDDPLNQFHYASDIGGGVLACDTSTLSISLTLTKNNGDGPAGHFMMLVAIGCQGTWFSGSPCGDFTDLGGDPRGTYNFSAVGDGFCGSLGVNYSGSITIS